MSQEIDRHISNAEEDLFGNLATSLADIKRQQNNTMSLNAQVRFGDVLRKWGSNLELFSSMAALQKDDGSIGDAEHESYIDRIQRCKVQLDDLYGLLSEFNVSY